MLPAVLKPAEKRLLDRLSEWPWITAQDLGGLMGLSDSRVSRLCLDLTRLGLVCRVQFYGLKRLTLSRWGLAVLVRGDLASISTAIRRWGAETEADRAPVSWRNIPGARSRPWPAPSNTPRRCTASLRHWHGRPSGTPAIESSKSARHTTPSGTSDTGAGCAPSTPTGLEWCVLELGFPPSSWNGSGGP